jgi:hemerythrin superfamily protein
MTTSIDAWERSDTQIDELLRVIETHRGPRVDDRAEYGKLAKLLLRRAAVHEAAVHDVVHAVGDTPRIDDVVAKIESDSSVRRKILDRMERKSRGVQGINLNQGVDFDGDLNAYAELVRVQVPWEQRVALPAMREVARGREHLLHDEKFISRHAPMRFRSRRWRRASHSISSWLLTASNHLGDFPWWGEHDPPQEVDLDGATRIVDWRHGATTHQSHMAPEGYASFTGGSHLAERGGGTGLMESAGELDIHALLVADHRQIAALFDDYDHVTPSERGTHLQAIVPVLVGHEMAEEEIVYPALRSVDLDARTAVRYRIQEQAVVEQMLKELEAMEPESSEFDTLFQRLRLAVRIHAEQEETTMFPLLERYADRLDRPTMGSRYRAVRASAPTHPHPSAPHSPPASTLSSPVMAALDRIHDAMSRRR